MDRDPPGTGRATRLPPGAAREILRDYQLWGDDGGDLVERPSLLVQDMAIKAGDNPFLFEAGHLIACGRGLRQLDMDSVWIGEDRDMPQPITMDWKATGKSVLHDMCIRGMQGKCLIWNAALNYPGPEHKGYLSIDDDTLVLPLSKRSSGIIPVLHFFGGAWGGWGYACQPLAEKDVPIIAGCVEVDFTATRQYALSHRCPLLSATQELPPLSLLSFPEGFCIHGDVFDDNWLQAAACWNVEVITISAPCPPWSGAAGQMGLHSAEGQLFMRAIGVCKILRPKIILIEQVAAFHSHPHRVWIEKALWFAGYQPAFVSFHFSRLQTQTLSPSPATCAREGPLCKEK